MSDVAVSRWNRRVRPGRGATALVSLLCVVAACVTPRSYAAVVHRDADGGILALEGPDADAARRDADSVMRSQCAGGYRIVAEDRVRTGERTTSGMSSAGMLGDEQPYPGYPLGYPPGYALGDPPGAPLPGPWYAPGLGVARSEVDTETTPIYEHRITYRCGSGAPSAGSGATTDVTTPPPVAAPARPPPPERP